MLMSVKDNNNNKYFVLSIYPHADNIDLLNEE